MGTNPLVRMIGPALAAALACGCASEALDRAQLSAPDVGSECAPRRRFAARFHVGEIARSSVVAPRALAEQFFNCGDAAAALYFLEFANEEDALEKTDLIAGALWGGPASGGAGEELLLRGRVAVIVSSANAPPPALVAKLVEKGFAKWDPGALTAAGRHSRDGRGAWTHVVHGGRP